MDVEALKKLNKNKELVEKLAKEYDAFLASEQIPRILGPGLNKAAWCQKEEKSCPLVERNEWIGNGKVGGRESVVVVGDGFRELDRILRISKMTRASSATFPTGRTKQLWGCKIL
ncbi:60S ribosomal protein L10a isoform X2 [Camelus ferus]|uniref:60S ribosomal protein L10a isoform X2 n=1 Tax=Camelus ferus TaxID=419612 RepID=A0A8B8TEV1_CAMFR|nr:60S ribosomal protein L10a isoform X2 [Camelus ferus]